MFCKDLYNLLYIVDTILVKRQNGEMGKKWGKEQKTRNKKQKTGKYCVRKAKSQTVA